MTFADRHILPGRRHVETRKLQGPHGQVLHLSVGYDPQDPTRPLEVFYSAGLKSGSDLEYHMQDMCVLISLLLQRGMTPDEVSHSLSRHEQPSGKVTFATLTGFLLSEIAKPPVWCEGISEDAATPQESDRLGDDVSPEPPHGGGETS